MSHQEKYEFSDYGRSPRTSAFPALMGGLAVWGVIAIIFAYLVVRW